MSETNSQCSTDDMTSNECHGCHVRDNFQSMFSKLDEMHNVLTESKIERLEEDKRQHEILTDIMFENVIHTLRSIRDTSSISHDLMMNLYRQLELHLICTSTTCNVVNMKIISDLYLYLVDDIHVTYIERRLFLYNYLPYCIKLYIVSETNDVNEMKTVYDKLIEIETQHSSFFTTHSVEKMSTLLQDHIEC